MLNNDTYEMLLMFYLKKNPEKSEINFIEIQEKEIETYIEKINNQTNEDILKFELTEFTDRQKQLPNFDVYLKNLVESKKKNNLRLIREYNLDLQYLSILKNRLMPSNLNIGNESELDLSNSNAVQKIIYLNELGIIELLRKEHCFSSSVNNLATIITAITGENHTTMQPYLQVLINKSGTENNNPYKSTSTVKIVKNQLINMGFKPK